MTRAAGGPQGRRRRRRRCRCPSPSRSTRAGCIPISARSTSAAKRAQSRRAPGLRPRARARRAGQEQRLAAARCSRAGSARRPRTGSRRFGPHEQVGHPEHEEADTAAIAVRAAWSTPTSRSARPSRARHRRDRVQHLGREPGDANVDCDRPARCRAAGRQYVSTYCARELRGERGVHAVKLAERAHLDERAACLATRAGRGSPGRAMRPGVRRRTRGRGRCARRSRRRSRVAPLVVSLAVCEKDEGPRGAVRARPRSGSPSRPHPRSRCRLTARSTRATRRSVRRRGRPGVDQVGRLREPEHGRLRAGGLLVDERLARRPRPPRALAAHAVRRVEQRPRR